MALLWSIVDVACRVDTFVQFQPRPSKIAYCQADYAKQQLVHFLRVIWGGWRKNLASFYLFT